MARPHRSGGEAEQIELATDEGPVYALGHFHEADPTTTQDQRQAKPSGLVDYLGRYRAEALAEPDQQPGDPGAGARGAQARH